MPFPQQEATSFTRAAIENITPGQYGCYGIVRRGAWIYVGKGDIRARLLAHLNNDNPRITREGPTHFYTVLSDRMDQLERELIVEYTPIANQRIG